MKKNKITKSFLLLLFTIPVVFWGCEELTEPNLTDKQITITAPVDNLVTAATTNTFAWEALDGATKYQLQIASPKFDSVVSFITDTSFTKPLLTYTLTAGKYQWRVRALNGGSQTSYFTRSITIQ